MGRLCARRARSSNWSGRAIAGSTRCRRACANTACLHRDIRGLVLTTSAALNVHAKIETELHSLRHEGEHSN